MLEHIAQYDCVNHTKSFKEMGDAMQNGLEDLRETVS